MEESDVYQAARYHMLSILAGDRQSAMADIVEGARDQAEPVFSALPAKVEEAEVLDLTRDADQYVVAFNYTGGDADVVVESVWSEQDGQPKIIGIRLAQ